MNRITNVKLRYFELFNCMLIEVLVLDGNTWNHLCVNKWLGSKIILVFDNNTWNNLTVCKQRINIKLNYYY